MGQKLNCWEYMHCNAGPNNKDGNKICPVASNVESNQINAGLNGGRLCWCIAGSLCKEQHGTSGSYVKTNTSCLECNFFNYVKEQEKSKLIIVKPHKNN